MPLVLSITLRDGAPDRLRLEGEIATIAPVLPGASIEERRLADAPEIGRAHAAFYDPAYFAAKKDDPTRKYRRLLAARPADDDPPANDGPPAPLRDRRRRAGLPHRHGRDALRRRRRAHRGPARG